MYYEKVSLRHPGRWFALLIALISFSPGTSTGSEYFPSGFPDPYYTGYFVAMKEPSIFELRSDETKELYRFAWFRSFHHPLVVRIESRGDGGVLRLARFRRIERKPTQLVDEKLITLDPKIWTELTNKVDKSGFWTSAMQVKQDLGTDGARWIFEGLRSGKYHVIDRWSPWKPKHSGRMSNSVSTACA